MRVRPRLAAARALALARRLLGLDPCEASVRSRDGTCRFIAGRRVGATFFAPGGAPRLVLGLELAIAAPVLYPPNTPGANIGVRWNACPRLPFEGRTFFGSREDLQAPRG